MKRLIIFLLLFAAIKVAGQTTGYLRFDTVKIMKQNGTCELYIINKTKDSTGGILTNIGGGLTSFKKSRINGDSLFVGGDTVVFSGGSGKLDSVTISTAVDPDPDTLYQWRAGVSDLVGLIPKGGGSSDTTQVEKPIIVKAGTAGDPDTLALLYDRTTLKITDPDSVLYVDLKYINVLHHGLLGDGSTNDAPAFQTLIDAGYRNFYFPAVNFHYRFATTISLPSNIYIWGDGWKSTIKTVTNDTVFHAAQKTGINMYNLRLAGNQGGTSQIGINVDSTNSSNFTNLVIDSMGRAAIRFTNNGLISPAVYEGNMINGCEGSFNGIGLFFDVRGEYNTANNCFFDRNTTGVYMYGGNNNIVGGHYNQNTIGIILTGTGNNGHHGIATGVAFNHNTSRSLYSSQVTLGYRFIGCHFFYGGMQIDTSANLSFSECNMEFTGTDSLIVKNTTNSYMWNCDFFTTPTPFRVVSSTFSLLQMGRNRENNHVGGISFTDLDSDNTGYIFNNNGVFTFEGTDIQQFLFNRPVRTQNGNFSANRDLMVGPTRIDHTGSITDGAQVFNNTLNNSTFAVIAQSGLYTARFMPNGNSGFGIAVPLDVMHGEVADAGTTTVTYPLRLSHSTSGTTAAGFGVGMRFAAENGSNTQRVTGTIETPYTNVTNASEAANIDYNIIQAGTLARRFTMTGTGLFTIGGITSSQPALAANGANLRARLADNSASTDLEVLDEAYDPTNWNGSLEVPTKNAIRDALESIGAITSINSQTGPAITLATGTAGTDFTITPSSNTITFDIPSASAANRGLVTTSAQTFGGRKTMNDGLVVVGSGGAVPRFSLAGSLTMNVANDPDAMSGAAISVSPFTFNDGGSARTVSNNQGINYLGATTLTADNAVNYENIATLYIAGEPNPSTNMTALKTRSLRAEGISHTNIMAHSVNESSSGTVIMARIGIYIFTGTTSTYTLPDLAQYQGAVYHIKNAGSGDQTVTRAGADNIYDTSSVTSIVIPAGESRIIVAGTSFWYVIRG